MTLFKEKYRIESTRMKGWDYTAEGCYYVTICTARRIPFFGQVKQGDVELSPIGEVVAQEWLRTAELRANVDLDEWVIMPDHMHGLLVITVSVRSKGDVDQQQQSEELIPRLTANSLGSIIGQFKGACTKRILAGLEPEFGWQTRYWDRIVRDEAELNRARAYIRNNPLQWERDRKKEPGPYM